MNKKLAARIKKYKKIRNMSNRLESQWFFMFLELLAFKRKYRHTNVPVKYKDNKHLGSWVRRQRYVHTTKKMDGLREELLRLASFNFRLLDVYDWNKMFGKLAAFKEKHGHAHIKETHKDVKLYYLVKIPKRAFLEK